MRKIVLPTDFSENAFNALKYAAELFKYEYSIFFILHAYSEEVYNTSADFSEDKVNQRKTQVQKSSRENLERINKEILKYNPNPKHHYKTLSSFGLLVDEVNDLITKENADIVVMGTRGKTNNKKKTFGSNTLQVIKYVQCPVLCIPLNYKYHSPEKILFPTNYMLPYERRELKLVSEIARRFCAELHLLYISRFPGISLRQKYNQEFIKDVFKQIKLEFHNLDASDKEIAINGYLVENHMDLLVMVNSRQTYLESFLAPSVIDKIGLKPKRPFLVLQNYNRQTQKE